MPVLFIVSLLIQIACVIHVLKTGRNHIWIWIIIFFSFLGCVIYFVMEIWPELRTDRAARKIFKTVDPHHDLKRLENNLEMSDNIENRIKLAEKYVTMGLYEKAIDLYKRALTGFYEDDPDIMLGLATALFHKEDYAKAKETLTRLIEVNPNFKSQEGHILFARTLEALSETEAALKEYQTLASYYSGYEAKCRYGLLLKKQGEIEKAQEIFKEILNRSKHLPRNYRKVQREWINIATQELR